MRGCDQRLQLPFLPRRPKQCRNRCRWHLHLQEAALQTFSFTIRQIYRNSYKVAVLTERSEKLEVRRAREAEGYQVCI